MKNVLVVSFVFVFALVFCAAIAEAQQEVRIEQFLGKWSGYLYGERTNSFMGEVDTTVEEVVSPNEAKVLYEYRPSGLARQFGLIQVTDQRSAVLENGVLVITWPNGTRGEYRPDGNKLLDFRIQGRGGVSKATLYRQ